MGRVARSALPVAFGGAEAPERWPRPPSAPRPELLVASVEMLQGVGPTLAKRLAKLGVSTVGICSGSVPAATRSPRPPSGSATSSATRKRSSKGSSAPPRVGAVAA